MINTIYDEPYINETYEELKKYQQSLLKKISKKEYSDEDEENKLNEQLEKTEEMMYELEECKTDEDIEEFFAKYEDDLR